MFSSKKAPKRAKVKEALDDVDPGRSPGQKRRQKAQAADSDDVRDEEYAAPPKKKPRARKLAGAARASGSPGPNRRVLDQNLCSCWAWGVSWGAAGTLRCGIGRGVHRAGVQALSSRWCCCCECACPPSELLGGMHRLKSSPVRAVFRSFAGLKLQSLERGASF